MLNNNKGRVYGIDFIRQLVENKPTIIRDERLQIDWLARGRYAIVTDPKSEIVTEFIKAGAPIKIVELLKGRLSSGSGHIALVNKAPHPNSAMVFINWLLSREGQTLYSRSILQQSAREDVPTDHLESKRKPGVEYHLDDEEAHLKRTANVKLAQEIFEPLLR